MAVYSSKAKEGNLSTENEDWTPRRQSNEETPRQAFQKETAWAAVHCCDRHATRHVYQKWALEEGPFSQSMCSLPLQLPYENASVLVSMKATMKLKPQPLNLLRHENHRSAMTKKLQAANINVASLEYFKFSDHQSWTTSLRNRFWNSFKPCKECWHYPTCIPYIPYIPFTIYVSILYTLNWLREACQCLVAARSYICINTWGARFHGHHGTTLLLRRLLEARSWEAAWFSRTVKTWTRAERTTQEVLAFIIMRYEHLGLQAGRPMPLVPPVHTNLVRTTLYAPRYVNISWFQL